MEGRFRFWTWWLAAVAVVAIAFGLSIVLLPDPMGRLFGGLYLSDPDGIAAFGHEAAGYIRFVSAVMGAVMAGWGAAILCVLALRFRPGNPDAWWVIAVSVLVWFIPDTAYSLSAGFWQNAVLNCGALILFAVPLAATYRASCSRGAHPASASQEA
ncbi:MAG: hypothetical protein Q7W51_07840 [Coriobacteriia bacterium]|nr:hypothetical protein [Coriobacteriia bacterium]